MVLLMVSMELLFLLPHMLLTPLARGGKHGLRDVKAAYHQFLSWNWSELICLRASIPGKSPTTVDNARKAAALRLVRCGELSHASRILTSNGLALSTDDTARKLISKHPPRSSALPLHAMLVVSRSPCVGHYFSIQSGKLHVDGAGPSGQRFKHFKILLENEDTADGLFSAVRLLLREYCPMWLPLLFFFKTDRSAQAKW